MFRSFCSNSFLNNQVMLLIAAKHFILNMLQLQKTKFVFFFVFFAMWNYGVGVSTLLRSKLRKLLSLLNDFPLCSKETDFSFLQTKFTRQRYSQSKVLKLTQCIYICTLPFNDSSTPKTFVFNILTIPLQKLEENPISYYQELIYSNTL